ncbi:phospholipase A2 inhibitor beta-like [Neodiprion pinetum]|uniref:Carboxypeptidase N subunit 2 n=1 Tax=Neodiprion lecontei TaxID=441921 RepID=A0A6J0BU06_NEOLC|nr:carboxypeptidase N subunit 2 [Neodiprion lecontei]XP_046476052.1 carboxypeptidase N subunit 2-like [Neodiprion pinetum]
MRIEIFGIVLAACVASCLAKCQRKEGDIAESYICEGISSLTELNVIPTLAQKITILNSKIPSLPADSFTRFSGTLNYLNITHSELEKIEDNAFARLSLLHELILDYNRIAEIRTDWIKDLRNLKVLRVWHNHIKLIEPEVFAHLPNLELLDIAYNQIDHCTPLEQLEKLDNLEIFYVTGNPWPLRCRPPVVFHLEHNHVQFIHNWGNDHILIEECLAHEFGAKWDDQILYKCVANHLGKLSVPPIVPAH